MDTDTRAAEFDYWLHDVGYRYTGDASLYALTLPEMARLYNGWESVEKKKAGHDPEADKMASREGVRLKGRMANPHRHRAEGSIRESDIETLREFEGRIAEGDS